MLNSLSELVHKKMTRLNLTWQSYWDFRGPYSASNYYRKVTLFSKR